MTLTGYYLFFKGRTGRLRRVASGARGALMRHRHGLVGVITGVWILLLVGSGLPWTGLWGTKVQSLVTGSGFSLWGEDPGATSTLGDRLDAAGTTSAPAPWAEGAAPLPTSGAAMGPMPGMDHGTTQAAGGVAGRVSLDSVVSVAMRDGLTGPYFVLYPSDKEGVFSVLAAMWHDRSTAAYTDTTLERVVHVDQYSSAVAGRYSSADYSPVAKVVSQTIAMHEGQRFGSLILVASALFCVTFLVLCVTGPIMWWRRRPKGSLGAPRGAMPLRARPWLLVALTDLSVAKILGCQIAIFIVVGLLLAWTPLRMALTPSYVKRTRAHRAAMEQFFARGVTLTKSRVGIMIFVSLADMLSCTHKFGDFREQYWFFF